MCPACARVPSHPRVSRRVSVGMAISAAGFAALPVYPASVATGH